MTKFNNILIDDISNINLIQTENMSNINGEIIIASISQFVTQFGDKLISFHDAIGHGEEFDLSTTTATTTIQDYSGNGLNLNVYNGQDPGTGNLTYDPLGRTPKWTPEGVNGKPAFTNFNDPTGDAFTDPAAFTDSAWVTAINAACSSATEITCYVACTSYDTTTAPLASPVSADQYTFFPFIKFNAGGGDFQWRYSFLTNSRATVGPVTKGVSPAIPYFWDAPSIIQMRKNTSTNETSIFFNGYDRSTQPLALPAACTAAAIGGDYELGAGPYDPTGYIGEIYAVVFAFDVTDEEDIIIRSFLSRRYGIEQLV